MLYNKPATTIDQQIALLRARGLIINDEKKAKEFLSKVSYYRLAGYWWDIQADQTLHTFNTGCSFEQVVDFYNFDNELRMLLFSLIERIEISVRSKMIYHLSHELGVWWFQDHNNFKNQSDFNSSLAAIRTELGRTKERFIYEHKRKYKKDRRYPPSWKTLEIVSFGVLSKMYGNLKNNISSKDIIANELGVVNHTFLPSWLQAISSI